MHLKYVKKYLCLILYYGIARHMPISRKKRMFGGKLRFFLCKRIFKKCGHHVNIEKGARFGNGFNVEIGDYSGIGVNASIPSDIKIGNYVMMGPNVTILHNNHCFESLDVPMYCQGFSPSRQTTIEDDVWICTHVIMTPGRYISKGSIIAAGCVLTKDFHAYSVIGGNPGKLIKSRKEENVLSTETRKNKRLNVTK